MEQVDEISDAISIAVVDESRWVDLEQLFESRGGPKTCWCISAFAAVGFEEVGRTGSRRHVMALRALE
jgi:hypothetical protein